MAEFDCVWPLTMTLGESPVWDDQQQLLFCVDIVAARIHRLDPAQHRHSSMQLDEAIGCIAHHRDGGFIAGLRSGIWQLSTTAEKLTCLADNPDNSADHRFNDGRCGPDGRLWLGTMDEAEQTPDAHLYAFDGQQLKRHKSGITISNGLAFSPDGQWLYHCDTPSRIIHRHAFDAAHGTLGPAQTWVDLNAHAIEGNPDGAAVDSAGHYWCALFGGGAVARFDPQGRLVGHYRLAAPNPTMPAFGGTDLRTLYVTTARLHLSPDELRRWPESGSIFALHVDTPGLREPRFVPISDSS